MIARIIRVEGGPAQADEVRANLQEQVLPRLQKQPGFLGGYWLRGSDGKGLTVLLWESAEADRVNEEQVAQMRKENFERLGLKLAGTETLEVLAHAEKAKAGV